MTKATNEDDGPPLPTFNPARMNELAEQARSSAIVYELLDLFLVDVEARLRDLSTSIAAADDDQRERVAHSIKGSCANLGAESMAELARTIEHCPGDVAAELLHRVDHEFAALKTALQQHYPTAAVWNRG